MDKDKVMSGSFLENGSYVDNDVLENKIKPVYDNSNVFDFFLMNKNVRVAKIKFEIKRNDFRLIDFKLIQKKELPYRMLGLDFNFKECKSAEDASKKYKDIKNAFMDWFESRLIPLDRVAVDKILDRFTGISSSARKSLQDSVATSDFALKMLALFSYGRSVTDKFWLNPVHSRNGIEKVELFEDFLESEKHPVYGRVRFANNSTYRKNSSRFFEKNTEKVFSEKKASGTEIETFNTNNLFFEYGLNINENDINLFRKASFKNMDFNKKNKGINECFGASLFRKNEDEKNRLNFDVPDFCTNGKTMKRFTSLVEPVLNSDGEKDDSDQKINILCLEKFYDSKAERDRIRDLAIKAKKTLPRNFPEIVEDEVFENTEFIVFDENGKENKFFGYKTMLFTNEHVELITFKDILIKNNFDIVEPDINLLLSLLESFGVSQTVFENVLNVFIENDIFEKFIDNAGLLVFSDSGEITKLVAWV